MISMEDDLAHYLNKEEFKRFTNAWIMKYKQLGYLGGSIVINNLNSNEKNALSLFLGKDLNNGVLKLSYSHFEKILNDTKYEGVDFFKVLNILNEEIIYSNKEIRNIKLEKRKKFIDDILNIFENTEAGEWLNYYFQNDKSYGKYIDNEYDYFFESLSNVCKAYNLFPYYENNVELIAVFSQKVTRNPHFFDDDFHKELLLKSICYLLEYENIPNDNEEKSLLLNKVGIYRDELSNYCNICHILPKDKNNTWELFHKNYEPWNMNMFNVNKVKEGFYKQNIYIFENPAVFYYLCQIVKEKQLNVGLICSHGQINLCTYQLLDKLVNSKCTLYYAGDFDPEGLQIADKLKSRYKDNLNLLGYQKSYFDLIKVKKQSISLRRLQLLNQINHKQLEIIADCIIKSLSFGYQEGLIKKYCERIIEDNSL